MPEAEVDVDVELVRSLLEAQHPDLASLPLRPLAFGWDNVILRLGQDLTVRLPRREVAAALVEHELRWLPELAPALPLPVPAPIRRGDPAGRYPWAWSISPWLAGDVAAVAAPSDPEAAASVLGRFVAALHRPAPIEAPTSAWRGTPLAHRLALTVEHIERLGDEVDIVDVRARWLDLVATDPWDRAPVWVHGDLHPANVLVHEGEISAVIDFGDLNAGDPATDLMIAWMLVPPENRATFRRAAGFEDDEATWRRGRAWALAVGLACLAGSADNPLIAGIGRRAVDAVLSEAAD